MKQDNRSIFVWGGNASILMTVAFIWIGIALMLDPVEQQRGEAFWQAYVEQPWMSLSWRSTFVIVGLLTLFVIPAATRLVRSEDGALEGLLHWTTALAYIGTAAGAIDFLRGIAMSDALIEAYTTGDVVAQTAVKTSLLAAIDANGVFRWGGVGLWYVVIGWLGMRNAKFSRTLAFFGIGSGVGYIFAMIFGITETFIPGTQIPAQAVAAMIAGAFVAPVFHVWLGIVLRKAGNQQSAGLLRSTYPNPQSSAPLQ
jgi:hypothetical protein